MMSCMTATTDAFLSCVVPTSPALQLGACNFQRLAIWAKIENLRARRVDARMSIHELRQTLFAMIARDIRISVVTVAA